VVQGGLVRPHTLLKGSTGNEYKETLYYTNERVVKGGTVERGYNGLVSRLYAVIQAE
jgi:hypothetical protein